MCALQGKNPENRRRPSILALSRQNLPNLEGTSIDGVAKGAYTVYGGDEKPDAIVLATGAWPDLRASPAVSAYVILCKPLARLCLVPPLNIGFPINRHLPTLCVSVMQGLCILA